MIDDIVSVIIPTYNRADKIVCSVKSVLAQTYDNIEVIVVDDASEDNTEEVVLKIKDSRLRYYKLSQNGGAPAARNYGASKAHGKRIAFQDSDDVWHPQKIEKQIELWNKQPENVMVYCKCEKPALSGKEMWVIPEGEDIDHYRGDIFFYLLQRNTIDTSTMFIEKRAYYEVGGFDIFYPAMQDWNLALKLAKIGLIGFVDEVLVNKTRTSGSISSSYLHFYQGRCKLLADFYDDLIRYNLFDAMASNILEHAAKIGETEYVKNALKKHINGIIKTG